MTRRVVAIVAMLAALFSFGYLSMLAVAKLRAAYAPHFLGTTIEESPPEPSVDLVDQDDKTLRLTDLRGDALLLFFGYAHCPDVCPTTLAKLARAYHSLGETQRRVAVAFVTVDPARDSVGALRRYVDLFNPRFYGLTGTQAALDSVYAAYHVWHQKLPSSSAAGYLMAHTSAIYMLDREGRLRVLHDWNDPVGAIVHDVRILAQ